MNTPGPWISGLSAARCGGCGGVFDMSKGLCPKGDSGEEGWSPVNSTRARAEITRLRLVLETVKAALLQIAHGLHSSDFKVRVAQKALDFMNEALKGETATQANSRVVSGGVN